MSDLTKEYTYLFNTITDIRQQLLHLCSALMWAQRQAEEIYISHTDSDKNPEDTTLKDTTPEDTTANENESADNTSNHTGFLSPFSEDMKEAG